ncbi:phosphoribosylformylglycinamidine synthase subunit PurL [Candidatus Caldatribacterium sp. SIUC1]|uniref:phosphoribosylformylglycinamidine synthase subunit PurL n=1 Tax=Candidatus Caldatribacterium sp. SIUC1 TaxID=3418365 RepID=UPI003F68C53F
MHVVELEKVARELGLRKEEYERILAILGRIPTLTEIAMFSVEWSEHCGYPHSRKWLELLPREGHFEVLVGEDAGGIVYDDVAIVFKMESHNHPSQIEPKQGAATGIGGIIRDILGSGARPIACLDSLHFGPLEDPRSRYVMRGVVEGIAWYGNCVGVPTVAGEVWFYPAFRGNCLVNVMCLGIAPREKLARARAQGVGNAILYVGNRTGRDGIGGCSILASQEFAENEEKRPSVQIGDPFTEKCLIEATLEALATGFVVGIKDMGAAGLTCSSSEMAASGGSGVDIDLDRVPVREEGMEAWEIMMSESQERMLLCVAKGHEEEIRSIFRKWGLEAEVIGRVTDTGRVTIRYHGEVVADIPAKELVRPPVYTPERVRPAYLDAVNSLALDDVPLPGDFREAFEKLLASPNLASKRWIFEQYDHMVQTNTVILPGTGTVVLRVKGKPWGIAVTTDCNPFYCYLDPYRGAQIAVAEAARNLAACGARPAGVTDCLNFGNPEKPDRYWQFVAAISGLSEACRFFKIPVVSGNVSFYNESPLGAVYPTPTIGMVGIVQDVTRALRGCFSEEGSLVLLFGETKKELGGSEYLRVVHGIEAGPPPSLDLGFEKRLQEFLIQCIEDRLFLSCCDVSEGGLAIAVAEAALSGERAFGVEVDLAPLGGLREDVLLFGESCGRALASVSPACFEEIAGRAKGWGIPCVLLGRVGGDHLVFRRGSQVLFSVPVAEALRIWEGALAKYA